MATANITLTPWRDRWRRVWQDLGVSCPDDRLGDRLLACYAESHRFYHTLQHLQECFGHLDTLRSVAERPAEVDVALWFHDAIYEPRRSDNEEKSAEWAQASALAVGVSRDSAQRIYTLIMATTHGTVPVSRDAVVLIDADLGIFGAAAARFDDYEDQIRQEYAWVPDRRYRQERRKVLEAFMQRSPLYYTEAFRTRYEAQARNNIARSLDRLSVSFGV